MNQKNKIKAIVAIAVAMVFVMPVAAFANMGTDGLENNIEETVDDILWEYSTDPLGLPTDADRLEISGNTLITDCNGNRVIEVTSDGTIFWEYSTGLCEPDNADRLESGNTLITDSGNNRVIEVNSGGTIVWEYSTGLCYPMGADRLEISGNTLITDCDNNRVIEVNSGGTIVWEYSTGLDCPYDADRLESGNTLITDYDRVIEVTSDGTIVWEYSTGLCEPFDAERLEISGNTLITDTFNNRIIEVNSGGTIVWEYSTGLDWPFDADRLKNGNTLITDSCNHRIIEVGVPAPEYTEITTLSQEWNMIAIPFNYPIDTVDIWVEYDDGTTHTWADAVTEKIVANTLFGWDRIKQEYLIITDTLHPGYGYWLWAYHDCILKVLKI